MVTPRWPISFPSRSLGPTLRLDFKKVRKKNKLDLVFIWTVTFRVINTLQRHQHFTSAKQTCGTNNTRFSFSGFRNKSVNLGDKSNMTLWIWYLGENTGHYQTFSWTLQFSFKIISYLWH